MPVPCEISIWDLKLKKKLSQQPLTSANYHYQIKTAEIALRFYVLSSLYVFIVFRCGVFFSVNLSPGFPISITYIFAHWG